MQFLLTREEYEALAPRKDLQETRGALAAMRKMLVPRCIYGPAARNERYGYCSSCPLSHIGHDSNEARPSREESKVLCDLTREYGK